MPKKRMKRHAVIQPLNPSYKIIALTQGQSTKVTAADFPWLDQWNWHASWSPKTHSFYAKRNEKKVNGGYKIIQMAREILGCKSGEEADHINRDTLDNQRKNLRKATKLQNTCNKKMQSNNTSGYIGVTWHKASGKWRARIMHKQISIDLGYFDSAEEAARVRDEAAKIYHGEFAVLNFP